MISELEDKTIASTQNKAMREKKRKIIFKKKNLSDLWLIASYITNM